MLSEARMKMGVKKFLTKATVLDNRDLTTVSLSLTQDMSYKLLVPEKEDQQCIYVSSTKEGEDEGKPEILKGEMFFKAPMLKLFFLKVQSWVDGKETVM